jgi:hypothetical protein
MIFQMPFPWLNILFEAGVAHNETTGGASAIYIVTLKIRGDTALGGRQIH